MIDKAVVDQVQAELARVLQEWTKDRLARYKYPRVVEFTDALPKNDRGKINRKALRTTHVEGTA